uniref:Uncharacterized protein n=1 Tax=Globodera pallida TaxID=36090 RepID=A0A183BVM1_GLOPA
MNELRVNELAGKELGFVRFFMILQLPQQYHGKSRGRESRQPSNPLITSHFGRSSFRMHFDNGFLIQKIFQSTTVYRAFIDTVIKTIR